MKTRPESGSTSNLIPAPRHEVASTTTLSAVIVGASTGLIGGPPGVVAGGIIGAAVGALAGTVMERDRREAFAHDKKLDETIGVIGGPIGAGRMARDGVESIERQERDSLLDVAELDPDTGAPTGDAAPSSDAPTVRHP